MKKILFLILIIGFFSPLINAYDYFYFYNSGNKRNFYYIDPNGILMSKYIESDGRIGTYNISLNDLYWINRNKTESSPNTGGWITRAQFINYLKSDLNFLNDWYIQQTNKILNFFYNPSFTTSNYIVYENYELLYNSDGLAVESIVNDVWAGLYDDSERGVSGRLYSSGGQLLYVNGKSINWMESQLIKLMDMVENSLRETVAVLGSLVPIIVAAVFVLLILYYVVSVGRRAIMPSNVKVRKRFLGSHNDEC